jgi:isopentenyl-diphosphate delta-isomerase type 1
MNTEAHSSSEELFDVVDAGDCVVCSRPRSVVHQQKLLHRAVHVFVFGADNKLLIHRRSPSKEEFPSVWTSSCSGHVSSGESYDETAPRELEEELGISDVALKMLHKFPACEDTSWEFTVLYSVMTDQEPVPDPEEITAVLWLSVDEIAAWLSRSPEEFSPAFRLLFSWYIESNL